MADVHFIDLVCRHAEALRPRAGSGYAAEAAVERAVRDLGERCHGGGLCVFTRRYPPPAGVGRGRQSRAPSSRSLRPRAGTRSCERET